MSRERLPKRIWILGWVSFFNDIASEMTYPIIPIFVTAILKAPKVALGSIEGTAEALVSFMKGWSGWRSDLTGQRATWVQAGYGLSGFSKPMLALAGAWPMVFLARLTDRFGKGVRTTARDALIADSVEKKDYGRAFGLHRTMDTSGAFIGGLILIGLLLLFPGQLRTVFLVATIPAVISVACTFFVKDAKTERPPERSTAMGTLKQMSSGYWRAILITLLFGLANSSDTFLLLRADELFATSIKNGGLKGGFLGWMPVDVRVGGTALVLTVLAYTLYNIFYVSTSYPAGVLSDRIGRWWVLGAGFLLYAAVYAGFAVSGIAMLWVLFALYGVYAGLTDGVGKALVADHAPPYAKGAALGFFYMASGVMTIVGNVVAGLLWDKISPQTTFFFGSAVALLVLLLIPLTRGMEKPATA